jgi:hypothetical protein
MRQLVLAAAIAIMLGASLAADPEVTPHVSREAAIKVLRDGGILWGKTRVVSAEWGSDTRDWLITLQMASSRLGLLTQPDRIIMVDRASISRVGRLPDLTNR